MKTIGFVDYYLSEWHANNYPAWIWRLGGGEFAVKYAWAELDTSPVDGRTTQEWCEAYGVERCASVEELCEKADCILVLAPSHPEKHLGYAKAVLPFGKPTYIDKTFAPDAQTAQAIFDLAAQYATPLFSSSALRYATELQGLCADAVITTGGGRLIEEYIIHQIEMAVTLTQAAPLAVRVEKQGEQSVCTVNMEGGKRATLLFGASFPFAVYTDRAIAIESAFFDGLLADILRFYREKTPSFDSVQTLWAMRIRQGVIEGIARPNTWIEV